MRSILFFIILMLSGQICLKAQQGNLFKFTEPEGVIQLRNSSLQYMTVDAQMLSSLYKEASAGLTLEVPITGHELVTLQLQKLEIFTPTYKVIDAQGRTVDVDRGIHYSGHIEGKPNSFATISIFKNSFAGLMADHRGNFVIGEVTDQPGLYALYEDSELDYPRDAKCEVKDVTQYSPVNPGQLESRNNTEFTLAIEADHDIYLAMGNDINAVANYLNTIYAQSIALYKKEGLTQKINQIKVWNTPSPYIFTPQTGSQPYLIEFLSKTNALNGDIGALLTFQDIGGGVASSIGAVCHQNPDSAKYVTLVKRDYANIPTYSWDVQVITHECGHLLGSYHTHGCYWNGNNTQIDDCASLHQYSNGVPIDQLEGKACFNPSSPIIPTQGGFIMSYCAFVENVGTNFSLGFGDQSRQMILNNLATRGACLGKTGGTIIVSPDTVIIPASGECQTVNVTGGSWKIGIDPNNPPSFLTSVSPTEGAGAASVSICADKNTLPISYGAKLFFQGESNTVEVLVIQEGVKNKAMFYPDTVLLIPNEGTIARVNILANIDWKIVIPETDKKWVPAALAATGNKHTDLDLNFNKNPLTLNRYSRVKMIFNNGLDSTFLVISQPGLNSEYINVPANLKYADKGAKYQFPLYSDMTWEFTSIPAWITLDPAKGKGNAAIVATLADNTTQNQRTADLTVRGVKLNKDTIVKVIRISQLGTRSNEAHEVSISPSVSDGNFDLNISDCNYYSLRVVSMSGEEVLKTQQVFINGADYRTHFSLDAVPGIYTAIIATDRGNIIHKIMIR